MVRRVRTSVCFGSTHDSAGISSTSSNDSPSAPNLLSQSITPDLLHTLSGDSSGKEQAGAARTRRLRSRQASAEPLCFEHTGIPTSSPSLSDSQVKELCKNGPLPRPSPPSSCSSCSPTPCSRATRWAISSLDLTMPDMDGEQVFEHLRELDPDACVVLSSGHSFSEAMERFTLRGLAGFIQKPYRLEAPAVSVGNAGRGGRLSSRARGLTRTREGARGTAAKSAREKRWKISRSWGRSTWVGSSIRPPARSRTTCCSTTRRTS